MTPAEIRGVIVAHEELAAALAGAVEAISGVTGAFATITNVHCSPERLGTLVGEAVGDGPAVVFVDLASGSCAFAARSVSRTTGRVALVTGVNLPILLDFVFHRDLPIEELARRLETTGRRSVEVRLAEERALADRPAQD